MVLAGCPADFANGILMIGDSTFDTGGVSSRGDATPPIPHARILKLTTTGDNDAVDASKTNINISDTKAVDAITNWPNMRGMEVAGAPREVERWQFSMTWDLDWWDEEITYGTPPVQKKRRDVPQADYNTVILPQIKAALLEVYNEWYTWKMKFDPLPYFSYINGADSQKWVGPNIDYSTGSHEIGIGTPPKLNYGDSLRINFVRYWPPASKVPSGLTKYLSVASWRDTAKSLPPRIAAYNKVRAEIEAMRVNLATSPLHTDAYKITVDGEEFQPLDRIRNNMAEVIREGPEVANPLTNLSAFNWNSSEHIITINSNYSGRLHEAYFGFVPDGNGYAHTKYTYPLY
jgi:hypothetical protein